MLHASRRQRFFTRPVWFANVEDRKQAGSVSEALPNVLPGRPAPSNRALRHSLERKMFESLGHLWTGPEIFKLDKSSARPRYLAQQWTVALDHAAYQAAHDQQFQVCQKGFCCPERCSI
jgi:hypothetical protein